MPSLQETLQAALGTAYHLERELGGGGMSRVFVATESALGRSVVIKVLPPELSETVSADRFHREIQVAAKLQHPHIVPLLTAGHAGPLLYYTMPLVEGETLRGRLAREGELPVPEACRILAEVARALSYAHRHGIVHRDIKPENILLSEGEAQVADFGIAKALAASTEGDSLTTRGLALGTPAYMAPEQAVADAGVDARADIYSLGVVAYEMLTGSTPFSERTAQAMMAAHAVRRPEPVIERRPAVPARLGSLVMRMLEKHPADRPQTPDEILRKLDAVSVPQPAVPTVPTARARSRRGGWQLAGGLATLALLAGIAWLRGRPPAAVLDPKVVAVVPFRVSGADSSLRYLREGMLDLLAAKLSGTKDLRTVDPRTMLIAWRQAGGSAESDVEGGRALHLTRRLGAARLLDGEVIGTPRHTVLNARLIDAAGGGEVRASVEGPADSLTSLVDRLAAQLLVLGSGESQHRLAGLTSYSLPALRAYIDGRAAYRQGDFGAARAHFHRAMELDSTFALAGLGHTWATGWLSEGGSIDGLQLAWRHRNRLSARDLVQLRSIVGPRYPFFSGVREDLLAREAFVASAPDDPDAWAGLADHLFHFGPLGGISDAWRRSMHAFQRALALDSSYAPALKHLPELYYDAGDVVGARRAVALDLSLGSGTRGAAVIRWFAQTFLRDTTLGAVSLTDDSLITQPAEIIRYAVFYRRGLADAESVLTLVRGRISNEAERRRVQGLSWAFYLLLGRPGQAQALRHNPATPQDPAHTILAALFADGDSTAAFRAQAEIPRTFSRPLLDTAWREVWRQYAAAQYDLSRGSTDASRRAVLAWKDSWSAQDTSLARYLAAHFAMVLDAQLAALTNRLDASTRLSELDSTLQTPPGGFWFPQVGNLVAARLWHERGDYARALAAVRRRVVLFTNIPPTLATSLRHEGRYAALAGDREGAIKAYRHYLALRRGPEPAVRPKVEQVRAELAALERESRDR